MATLPTIPSFGDIPPFTSSGALPPFLGGNPAVPAKMSPYGTTLVKLVDRFATSNVRKDILKGYLDHRAALLNLGITGFQWLDGSFLEDIEALESRPPGDIDLVTFVWRPAHLVNDQAAWIAVVNANLDLFNPSQAKVTYKTDPYFVETQHHPRALVEQTTYWFGLFSHRRVTSLWKGMLTIPLDTTQDDAAALALLATK
jgi:hypothetical protein